MVLTLLFWGEGEAVAVGFARGVPCLVPRYFIAAHGPQRTALTESLPSAGLATYCRPWLTPPEIRCTAFPSGFL